MPSRVDPQSCLLVISVTSVTGSTSRMLRKTVKSMGLVRLVAPAYDTQYGDMVLGCHDRPLLQGMHRIGGNWFPAAYDWANGCERAAAQSRRISSIQMACSSDA